MHAGLPGAKVFGQGQSLTYDDVIFLPGHIDFAANEVNSMPQIQSYKEPSQGSDCRINMTPKGLPRRSPASRNETIKYQVASIKFKRTRSLLRLALTLT